MKAVRYQRSMSKDSPIYLVTGSAGFIGSNICEYLLSNNTHPVVVGIDNLHEYYSSKIKRYRLHKLKRHKRFIFYTASILEENRIQKIIKLHKPTILIHTAAEVGVRSGEQHPLGYFSTNVIGTLCLLEACHQYINHAIIFSSSSVYGSCKKIPFSETEKIDLSTPISTYGASKASMEIAVKNFYERTKISTTIIRPFSVYGPNGRPDMLPIKLLISAKNNVPIEIYDPDRLSRDWTYIDDFIHLCITSINNPSAFQIINIGTGKPILLTTVIGIAREIIQNHGLTLQYSTHKASATEMSQTWADNKKVLSLGDSFSFTDFRSGYKKTADFFFAHPDLYNS